MSAEPRPIIYNLRAITVKGPKSSVWHVALKQPAIKCSANLEVTKLIAWQGAVQLESSMSDM